MQTACRMTSLAADGRPRHAVSDGYPFVVNMRVSPYECVACVDPCDVHAFYCGQPDCERRHAGTGDYRDRQAAIGRPTLCRDAS